MTRIWSIFELMTILRSGFGVSVFDVLTIMRAVFGVLLFAFISLKLDPNFFRIQFYAIPAAVLVSGLFWSLPHEREIRHRQALRWQALLMLAANVVALAFLPASADFGPFMFFLAVAISSFENYTSLKRRRVREKLLLPFAFGEICVLLATSLAILAAWPFEILAAIVLVLRAITIGITLARLRIDSDNTRSRPDFFYRTIKFAAPRMGSSIGAAILASHTPAIGVFAAFTRFQTLCQLGLPTLVRIAPASLVAVAAILLGLVAAIGFGVFAMIFVAAPINWWVLVIMGVTIGVLFLAERAQYTRYLVGTKFDARILTVFSLLPIGISFLISSLSLTPEIYFLANAVIFFFLYRFGTYRRREATGPQLAK